MGDTVAQRLGVELEGGPVHGYEATLLLICFHE